MVLYMYFDFQEENYKLCFTYFLTKTHAVGTQKKRINETVILSTPNNVKVNGKETIHMLHM